MYYTGPVSMEEKTWKTKYMAALLLILAGIVVYGIITMQYVLAILLIGFTVVIAAILWGVCKYFSDGHGFKFRSDASVALFVAVFLAFFGMALAPWLVWAVALMALFLILQSVIRIERQLKLQETDKGNADPGPGDNGAGRDVSGHQSHEDR